MKTRDDKSLLLQDWKVGFGIVFFAMLTSSILFQAVPWAAQALEPCFDARAVHGSSTFNATAAWDIEKARVEATAFNIEAWNITTIEYEGTTYNMTELSYETPNWVGATPATWRINGTLFSPTNASGDIGLMPGIVLFHGNGGNRQASYNYGLSFAALNCTVLCVDHVGQGDSQGPDITVENTVVQGAMNETAYVYLILCNGMQAVRLLRSYTGMVDVNRIAVSGFSLGGMTSITISAIYADKIALSIPIGYFGGLINMTAESSFWPGINMTRQEFLSYYASHPDCLNILEPFNYFNIANLPDMMFIAGTNDEYFYYAGINDTYNLNPNTPQHKWLQVVPNGHHVRYGDDSPQYLVSYKFFGGPAPPEINFVNREKTNAGAFDRINIQANITCEIEPRMVELCYRFKNIFADPWHTVNMTRVTAGGDAWAITLDGAWLASELEYFVKVTVDAPGNAWFTSPVMTAGVMNNYLSILFIAGIVAVIALPIILVLMDRYKVEVKGIEKGRRKVAKMHFIVENSLVGVTEIALFGSISITWYFMAPTQPWSLSYMMEAYFTYEQLLKGAAFYLSAIILTYLVACGISGCINPLLSGILNGLWAILWYVMVSMIGASFGSTPDPQDLGPGFYLFVFAAIGQVGIWIWKRVYHKRLGIPIKNLITIIKSATEKKARLA